MLKKKAFIFNFIAYAIFFVGFRYAVLSLTNLSEMIGVFIAAFASIIISPKFATVQTKDGLKLFVKWFFIKGVKEIS